MNKKEQLSKNEVEPVITEQVPRLAQNLAPSGKQPNLAAADLGCGTDQGCCNNQGCCSERPK